MKPSSTLHTQQQQQRQKQEQQQQQHTPLEDHPNHNNNASWLMSLEKEDAGGGSGSHNDHDTPATTTTSSSTTTISANFEVEFERTLYPQEITGRHKYHHWRRIIEEWLYPPHLPRSCQLLRIENLAVPACYLLVGILQGVSAPLINVLPLDLGATEAQQTTISAIRGLPASFKLVFGFASDNCAVCGLRRKPYMFLGWVMASISLYYLLWTSNLHNVPARNAGCFRSSSAESSTSSQILLIPPQDDAPSMGQLSVCLLFFGIGYWMADVMADSLVAEKAKFEPVHARGSVQSSCYAYRFFGAMCAAPLSTYLYAAYGPHAVVQLLALLPLCILPLVYRLYEPRAYRQTSTTEQCHEIWRTVCSRSVWQPMGFVYIYNVLQVSNAAWREFLVTVLHFTSCQLNLLLIVASILLYVGILCYKYYMITYSWRNVYVATTLLNGLFSMGQILLIHQITFGLSPFLFALGDDALQDFIGGIQFLPTTIMMVHLCPTGSEGASYAMFTTVNNSALTLSSALSTRLLRVWPVDPATLQRGEKSGMLNLTYLTTLLQVSAIAFVGLLPHYKEDLIALSSSSSEEEESEESEEEDQQDQQDQQQQRSQPFHHHHHHDYHGTSAVGGAIFLMVTFGSILYAVTIGVLNIVRPT